jgi:hypothetical protein
MKFMSAYDELNETKTFATLTEPHSEKGGPHITKQTRQLIQ